MTEFDPHQPQPATGGGLPAAAAPAPAAPPRENVGLGLAAALVVVIAAGVLAVIVWNLGFVASITSLVLAVGASMAYAKVAGAPPRRGVVPLVVLIALGVVGTALAFVAWDASQYYDAHLSEAVAAGYSRGRFVWETVIDGEVLKGYAGDLAFFFLFAVIGTFGVFRRLLSSPSPR